MRSKTTSTVTVIEMRTPGPRARAPGRRPRLRPSGGGGRVRPAVVGCRGPPPAVRPRPGRRPGLRRLTQPGAEGLRFKFTKVRGTVTSHCSRQPDAEVARGRRSGGGSSCHESGHSPSVLQGKRPLLLVHGIFFSLFSNPPGDIIRRRCPRVRPRGHTTQRARGPGPSEIFKPLSLGA